MKKFVVAILSFLLAGYSGSLSSCIKKPDIPPDISGYDPHLNVTHTIAQIQAMPQGVAIASDYTIAGIVVMNDEHGNYHNKIVIQDATGGIEVCLNKSHLYHDYPVGRKVYIKCKGLFQGNYNQNLQLGAATGIDGSVADIPEVLIKDYIVKANYPNVIVPDTVPLLTLSSLYTGRQYLNKLVTIRQAEFAIDNIGIPYAQPSGISSSTALLLKDCTGANLILRTSAYATFQSAITPAGNGTITGVYTVNNNTPQLFIRNTTDVWLKAVRCDGTLPAPTGCIPIATIRNLCPTYTDSINALPAIRISGVVISDKDAGNIAQTNIVLQDGSKGIVIRFSEAHSFLMGDSMIIDVKDATLSWSSNLLYISNIAVVKAVKIASGKTIIPRLATIAQIQEQYSDWESTLVKINHVSITNGGTFSGNKTMNDGSGTLTLYTRGAASFASEWIVQTPRNYTGILSTFNNTRQLQMRNIADVE
jgi:DNA/RNA endonuclease YhcR with UshA esterase domain